MLLTTSKSLQRSYVASEDAKLSSFVQDFELDLELKSAKAPDDSAFRDILNKALSVQSLTLKELASLIQITDPERWAEMFEIARQIKHKVYDNRIVMFAPLYCSNKCINNCLYCGFRSDNHHLTRKQLSQQEIEEEAKYLAGTIGHKRLIMVFGEHPESDIDYILDSMKTVYSVKTPARVGMGSIRRVNINAAPMSVEDLNRLHQAGIGTYQVFQESYHQETYQKVHPQNSLKGHFNWRLYAMHRAMEAGIDDVGIGALFGLYDWRFELLGLLSHAKELEKHFGVGPHTVSFPRMEYAAESPFSQQSPYLVNDDDFRKIVTLIRLAVPYAGMIITAREKPEMIRSLYPIVTQRDASTCIEIGGYQQQKNQQEREQQQFELGDTRSLDEVIRELGEQGYITSFCTAGYRCGRTGDTIMGMLKSGKESCFCKLNAVLTYREWLDDFASAETKKIGEKVIQDEIAEIKATTPEGLTAKTMEYYERIASGERDLFI